MSPVLSRHPWLWLGTTLTLRTLALFWITILVALPLRADDKVLLVLGDSISAGYGISPEQGWVSLLQQRLNDKALGYRVVNASVSGNTSGDGVGRLPALLASHQPALVIVELGGNDGLRGYPVKTLRLNLSQLVTLGREAGAKVLLAGIEIPPNYGKRYSDQFRASFSEVASATNTPLVPFILDGIGTNPELMQRDGIHPTAEAQLRLLDNIWPTLEPLL
ncbi:MAG: arylesterase [Gammaproteobacteria bacterium]|nr:arylesterase [Gammaproteobacteria bacterium]